MEELTQNLVEFLKYQQEQNQAQQAQMAQSQQDFLKHLATAFNPVGVRNEIPHPAPDADAEFRMESLGQTITEFEFSPDNNITFDAWYSRYESLFTEDAVKLSDPAKTRLLLRKLSTRCHQLYINSILPHTPKDIAFADTIVRLKSIFGRQESLFSSRYKCLQLIKSDLDDFSVYAANVNKHCEEFKLAELTADQFKCLVFVCGLQSHQYADVRTKLLSTIDGPNAANTTLQSLITECHRISSLKSDTALIEVNNVNAVQHKHRSTKPKQHTPQQNHQPQNKHQHDPTKQKNFQKSKATPKSPCWFCGDMHYSRDCQFKSHICRKCNKKGHKEGYCDSSKDNMRSKSSSKSSNVITRVNQLRANDFRKYVQLRINNIDCNLQIDTGSDITLISEETWRQIGQPKCQPSSQSVRNASGDALEISSEFQCSVQFGQRSFNTTCYLTPIKGLNLLGIDWIDQLGIWEVPINSICNAVEAADVSAESQRVTDTITSRFPAVFRDSPGLCTKFNVELRVKPGQQPVFRPKRPVAFAAVADIDNELDRLQKLGIIHAVEYSQWAAPIVVVRKTNGTTRICADFSTGLNDALQPYPYPLPTPDEIFSRLSNCEMFSLIDLSDAFFQVQVHENSRELLTINTHRGLFRYHRLPFGVKIAPGAFQQVIDMMIAGLTGTSAYLDDILITGKNIDDHNRNLNRLFERIQLFGFTIKAEKCSIAMRELEYLGHILDRRGIRPNPSKTLAIAQMPAPTDLATLRSYLGGINFYCKYVNKMHELRHPLNELLKKDAEWSWTPECQRSFDEFKKILQSDLLLTHYNPALELIVAGDASNSGIGACILHRFQDGSVKAIYHASRTLNSAERNYSQIEKEGLALIYAVTKFHRMVYGRHFVLQTDHKPLLSIFGSKKGIPVYTANRLQRWALTLIAYDFTIEYVKTDDFGHADILSRLIATHTLDQEDTVVASVSLERDICSTFFTAISTLPLTHADMIRETKKSSTLQRVIDHLANGWPNKRDTDPEIAPYCARQSSLSVANQCLMFGERVVVPECYRQQILQRLHQDHPGQVRMKSLARSFVYWPGIDKQIAEYVRHCEQCIATSKTPIRVPLHPWPKSSGPWARIHIDFAGPVNGRFYIIIVDAHSKWPEVFATSTITTTYTIDILTSLFSRFGNPETIVSDNGTQFTSAAFQQFCKERGIQHTRTAPYHPQSNGQAERFVDTFKRALKKLEGGDTSTKQLDSFLSTYRATPNRSALDGKCPSELFIGRRIRTTLDLLLPSNRSAPSVDYDQQYAEQQYNRKHGVKPKSFKPGDAVYVRVHSTNKKSDWTPGIVIEAIGQVMYNIHIEHASRRKQLIRAHIDQMLPNADRKPSTANSQSQFDTLIDIFDIHQTPAPQPLQTPPALSPERSDMSTAAHPTRNPAPTPAAIIEHSPAARPVRQRRAPAYLRAYELF